MSPGLFLVEQVPPAAYSSTEGAFLLSENAEQLQNLGKLMLLDGLNSVYERLGDSPIYNYTEVIMRNGDEELNVALVVGPLLIARDETHICEIESGTARYIESISRNFETNLITRYAEGRVVRAGALGYIGLDETAKQLKEVEDLRHKLTSVIVLDSNGIIKNGFGRNKTVNLTHSKENMVDIAAELPADAIPEGTTHAAYAYKVTYEAPLSDFSSPVPTVDASFAYTVLGKKEGKKFIPLASVLPARHPARAVQLPIEP
jgi:hypothetical protein